MFDCGAHNIFEWMQKQACLKYLEIGFGERPNHIDWLLLPVGQYCNIQMFIAV